MGIKFGGGAQDSHCKFSGSVRDCHVFNKINSDMQTMVHFILAFAMSDLQTANFNSTPNFLAIMLQTASIF